MISQMEFDMTAVHSAFRRNYISRCTNTFAGSATRPAAAALKECSLVGSVDDSTAARALSRVLCKGDFDSFEVIGQFNLGFIIARSTRPADAADDLFILDQHACDEKYRFEQLQQRTAVHSQPLLRCDGLPCDMFI
jgi:DNA mismatch repair protein PMS2